MALADLVARHQSQLSPTKERKMKFSDPMRQPNKTFPTNKCGRVWSLHGMSRQTLTYILLYSTGAPPSATRTAAHTGCARAAPAAGAHVRGQSLALSGGVTYSYPAVGCAGASLLDRAAIPEKTDGGMSQRQQILLAVSHLPGRSKQPPSSQCATRRQPCHGARR